MRSSLPLLTMFAIAAMTLTVPAQSTMPGMQMPSEPAPQQKPPLRLQTPGDMKPAHSENPHARAADQSVQNSEAQQRANEGKPPTETQSLQHDTYTEQEFEAPGIHTGADLPAPELLGDAAAREPLTLQTVEGWAEASNPTLAEARALVEKRKAQARQAALPPDPVVGYSGEHLRGGSYGGGENGAFAQQTIVLGRKLALRRDIFNAEAGAQTSELQAQTLRVHNDVERAFYDALTAQAQVDLHRRLLAISEEGMRTAHELANLGQQDAPEVLDAEVEHEQAKVEFEATERLYIERFAMLAAVSGRPGEPLGRLQGALEVVPVIDTGSAVGEIVTTSPTVRASEQEVSVAEAQLRDAHRENVPNLRVEAGAWWSGEQLNGTTKPAGWMGFGQVGVNLPLWNRNQGNVQAAAAEVARAKGEVTRAQLTMKQRAEPLAQRYLAARFQAERYRDQLLPRAERAHELYVLKYQQMAASYPDVLLSERTVLHLRMAYLDALNEEWRAVIALKNDTLEGGLDAPMVRGGADNMLNLPTGVSE